MFIPRYSVKYFFIVLIISAALFTFNCANCNMQLKADNKSNNKVSYDVFSELKPGEIHKNGKYKSTDGKAILIVKDNHRIIKLKGTIEEMGYNYGYMLAGEIRNLFFNYINSIIKNGYPIFEKKVKLFKLDENFSIELDNIIKGFNDALPKEKRIIKLN